MKWLHAAALVVLQSLSGATVPAGFVDLKVVGGLSSPTAMAFAPDGRLFVCQQDGALRVVKNGVLLSAPFLTVTVDSEGERGLLGVTFDPDFTANNFLYVYYTRPAPDLRNVVSRFTANGDVAEEGSETVLLELNPLGPSNHNGGALHFGADGKLYIGVGENAERENAQRLSNLLGKVLRMNADGSIPPDNPFFETASGVNRLIWALGLRNPFTFAVQPGTGRMFINDVGENTVEEVNEGFPGANYGWPECEGECATAAYLNPIHSYTHEGSAGSCAITGGAFYNPAVPAFPDAYTGMYFFADYCAGFIRLLDPASGAASEFLTGGSGVVDVRVGPEGSLYYLNGGTGELRRVDYVSRVEPLE